MPIYEYRCTHCEHCFEALVWSSKEECELKCPRCECGDIERLLSLFARSCSPKDSSTSNCGAGTGGFS